jgi:hypothetical protein
MQEKMQERGGGGGGGFIECLQQMKESKEAKPSVG